MHLSWAFVKSRFLVSLVATAALAACGESATEPEATTSTQSIQQPAIQQPVIHDCNLVMGWDPWEPYQYQVTDQDVVGLDVEILTAVLNNAGCNISFRRSNWTALLNFLQSGEVDVLAGATQSSGRDQFAWFTDAYRDEEFRLYVTADDPKDNTSLGIAQLLEADFRIGVIEGYMYGKTVAELQNNPRYQDQFVYSSMGETSIALLLDHKVDGIIEDKFVGAAIIRRKFLSDQVSQHPLVLHKTGVRFMISRASVDETRFKQINQSLNQLLADGHIQEVLGHYLNQ